jgi:hypothetical protein
MEQKTTNHQTLQTPTTRGGSPLGRWKGSLTKEDLPVPYIAISEHLDMVGVQMKASFLHTRKVNCDVLQDKVKNVIWIIYFVYFFIMASQFYFIFMAPHFLSENKLPRLCGSGLNFPLFLMAPHFFLHISSSWEVV